MEIKFTPTVLLSLVFLGLLFMPASAPVQGNAPAVKDYAAEQYDVNMIVRPDGSILVTETIVFRFTGGPFTYVFREIPAEETDGIEGITGNMDGIPFPLGEGTGRLEVKGRNRVRVTWRFSPVSDSIHTFNLSYRVLGVTRVDEKFDLLRWNAIPFDHDYLIQSSTVRVNYPKRAKLYDTPSTNLVKTKIESSPAQITFQVKTLREDVGLQISIRFNRNSLISQPPEWQRHRLATNQAVSRILPWAIGALVLMLIAGIALVYLYWEHNAAIDRQTDTSQFAVGRLVSPPSELPPAVAGALIAHGARPGWLCALATLLDLAQRGVISIEESREKKWFQQRDFIIRSLEQPNEIRPYERGLLEILFHTKRGVQTNIKISELSRVLPYRMKKFTELLKEEMQAAELISLRRWQIGDRMSTSGIILLISSLAILVISLIAGGMSIETESWGVMYAAAIVLGISISAVLVSLIAIIVSGFYSPLTDKGLQEAINWRAYAEYLRDVTREREPVTRQDLFETALPYAASFGLAETWSKFFQKRGEIRIPPWFQALSAAGDEAAGSAAFVAMIAASSAASSSGVSGGAGAASGGSSGAG